MSEETQESGMSGIKKTLVGLAGAIATAVGGYVVTHIEAIFGGEEETKTEVAAPAPAAAPVIINLENNNTNQQKQTAAPQVIRERVIEKPAAAPVQAAPVKPAPAEEEDPW